MASATNSGYPTNFILTPQQQSLLFAALNSNKQQLAANQSPGTKATSMSPSSFQTSPAQAPANGFQESPYLDNYDYDFGDSSFDFDFTNDQGKMIGDIPSSAKSTKSTKSDSTENDTSDKRPHPDDEDDEGSPGNDPKRREGAEKVPKKPGRKPLTSEPSSKRKAQNRAAQRAFRERKEKHLKDLETKVEELEKASKDASSENSILKAQIEKMTGELNEYKTKLAAMSTRSVSHGKSPMGFGASAIGNLSDVNFQFEFPKFGVLPGSTMPKPVQRAGSSASPQTNGSNPVSPLNTKDNNSPHIINGLDFSTKDDLATFTSLFSPSMSASNGTGTSRASVDSGPYSMHNGTSTSSPSASSQSNAGPSSSCGTSPEPFTQSPMGFKPVDTMTTIGEEHTGQQSLFAGIDTNSIDWFAQQNGGQFDPQLFGNYREPQENILGGNFDESFFNEALDADFITPYNMAAPSPAQPKKNLIDQIDAAKNADDDVVKEAVKPENYNCNKIWEKLQDCPSVQSGEFDLDGLCSELQKKAKCSGQGPVVSETDFQSVVNKWMGKDAAACFQGKTKA
ncbi:transcription factor PAP1 [Colletotrichum karsti]|uniref:Transcription factor PAP1 n=1 Tax=Colletotrichum karsti TaxID=1095194 RepID=A0A9P6I2T2_9PEZI|nr:transcription factor PAP1 [Colletotrichum karsti]KAF9876263.1 transcription factor PAP1 [Colletotrichum karsti]